MTATQTSEQTAIFCLQSNEWKLEQAASIFFDNPEVYQRDSDHKKIKIEQLFRRYEDRNDPSKMNMDGVCRFLDELRLDPTSKLVLIIAWKFRAEKQCEFSRDEFVNGFDSLSVDSIDSLRAKLPALESELRDPNKFKDFYQFTFNYAKEDTQKGIDLEMAIAYWNIVLKGRHWRFFSKTVFFSFLFIFSKFSFLLVLIWSIRRITFNYAK